MPKRGDSSAYTLNNQQVKAVLSACLDLLDRVIIGCLLFLGLSPDEIVHVRADWITQDGNLKIPTSMPCNCTSCSRKGNTTWRPRGKAKNRTLPIPPRFRRDLGEILRVQPYGLNVSRITVYNRTKAVLRRARVKIPGPARNTAFPDALRATCAKMLRESGMSTEALAYYMGIESIPVRQRAKDSAIKQAKAIFA